MEKKLIFATSNEGKMKEIREIMADQGMVVLSLKEAGIDIAIEEDGTTFEANALKKARAVAGLKEAAGALVLADDSGLEIDYLNREPGVYSARYGGEDTPYPVKNKMLLERLLGVEDSLRTARFVCVIAAVLPDGEELTAGAAFAGRIAHEIRGEQGFGYDPIFYVPEFLCTSAELTMAQKNEISHRGKALRKMKLKLSERGFFLQEESQ